MRAQSKVIEMSFDLQAFEFEESIESREDMIILGHNSANRCFAQGGILFE